MKYLVLEGTWFDGDGYIADTFAEPLEVAVATDGRVYDGHLPGFRLRVAANGYVTGWYSSSFHVGARALERLRTAGARIEGEGA